MAMSKFTSTQQSTSAKVLLTLAAFVVVIAGLKTAQALIVPFLLAIFIAIVSAPPMFWLERKGLPKFAAMLSVLGFVTICGIGISAVAGSSIGKFSRQLPHYKQLIAHKTTEATHWLQAQGVPIEKNQFADYFDPGAIIQLVGDIFNGFGGVLANTFLILLTVVFILFEAHSFPSKLRAISATPESSLARFGQFSENVNHYLAIKTMASLGTGAAIALWMIFLGVKFPLLWGLLAFLLNFVPNIGSIIAAVPAVLFALVDLGLATAGWTAGGFMVVNTIVGNAIEPRFMGRGLGLSTLVVFISLVFWGWVFGPVGMFLSVPLTMTAKIALDSAENTRWIAVLLGPEGEHPKEPPDEEQSEEQSEEQHEKQPEEHSDPET